MENVPTLNENYFGLSTQFLKHQTHNQNRKQSNNSAYRISIYGRNKVKADTFYNSLNYSRLDVGIIVRIFRRQSLRAQPPETCQRNFRFVALRWIRRR